MKKNRLSLFAVSILVALFWSCGTKDSSKAQSEQSATEAKKQYHSVNIVFFYKFNHTRNIIIYNVTPAPGFKGRSYAG